MSQSCMPPTLNEILSMSAPHAMRPPALNAAASEPTTARKWSSWMKVSAKLLYNIHVVDVADDDGVEQVYEPQQPIKGRADGLARAQVWGMTGAGVLPTNLILLWFLLS